MRRKNDVDIGVNVRKAMAAKCMKTCDLAKAIDVSPQLASQYKNGTSLPSYDALIAMSKLFNVSTDWILGLADCRTPDAFDLLPEQTRADLKAILNSPKRDKLLRLCAEVLTDEHQ